MILYHGTKGDFASFNPAMAGTNRDSGWYGAGFYLTPHPQLAKKYGPNVLSFDVSLRNPYRWPKGTGNVRSFTMKGTPLPQDIHNAVLSAYNQGSKTAVLKVAQYDAGTILGESKGGPAGSNRDGVSGFWRGKDNIHRYVKQYRDPAQVYGEALSNYIYRALGLGAPNSYAFQHKNQPAFASELIDAHGTLGEHDVDQELARKVAQGFAADVLLANWDAVGMGLDNVIVHGDRDVSRIDQGGTLLMRAQNGRKPDHLLHAITEWEGFFNRSLNWDYSNLMGKAGYSKAEDMGETLIEQIEKIEALRNQHGGWDKLVTHVVPQWSGPDRDTVVKMLESRTKLLNQKKAEIQRTLQKVARIALAFLNLANGWGSMDTSNDLAYDEHKLSQAVTAVLKAKGHDGVIYQHPDHPNQVEYVVFDAKNARRVNHVPQ